MKIIDYVIESTNKYIEQMPKEISIFDPGAGFRVIIMTQAHSQVNTRVLELLQKIKTLKNSNLCAF